MEMNMKDGLESARLAERQSAGELSQMPPDAGTPAGLLAMAVHAGRPLDYIERLLAVKKEFDAMEARKAYVAAMARFKKNPPRIIKDKKVGYTTKEGDFVGYSHASLGNVVDEIVAGLAREGFSHRWDIEQSNRVKVTCVITHELGHSESVPMSAEPDGSGKKNAIQQVASAISYLQRYTLLAATGLAVEDGSDDDGRGTGSDDDAGREKSGDQQQRVEKVAYTDADIEKNLPSWRKIIDERKRTAGQIIATLETKVTLTEAQKKRIHALMPAEVES